MTDLLKDPKALDAVEAEVAESEKVPKAHDEECCCLACEVEAE